MTVVLDMIAGVAKTGSNVQPDSAGEGLFFTICGRHGHMKSCRICQFGKPDVLVVQPEPGYQLDPDDEEGSEEPRAVQVMLPGTPDDGTYAPLFRRHFGRPAKWGMGQE